ncbi:histidine kinase CKI1 [Cucurbita maxima]|uniref:histidine kinase n=1 Tax=Cucurbita maxima TaxID=3661 RepID=A0A6J1HK93_CUCMA|nr:histidine kinase CKI1 [Cucurbita maxima]
MERISTSIQPIYSSTTSLVKTFDSSLNGTQISSFELKSKIAPMLFQGFAIIPYLTQISYIGIDGLFFSYYTDKNQTFAVYSNSTFTAKFYPPPPPPPPPGREWSWLTQLVNSSTGELYGDMVETLPSVTTNTSWFRDALNNQGSASVGKKWSSDQELLLLNTVRVNGRNGVLSFGFSIKALIDLFFTSIERQGGRLYLASTEGEILVQGFQNIKMVLANGSASFRFLKPNGNETARVENISCRPRKETFDAKDYFFNLLGTNYMIYCSPLEILGVQLLRTYESVHNYKNCLLLMFLFQVYSLVLPQKELASLVHKSSRMGLILLILTMSTTVISIFGFVFIVIRAANREMHLCAKLIQQMEATQQAERKSMNKSVAFTQASHDIRASLAGIIGLIEICHNEAAPGSDLNINLKQMDGCTKDLLAILNSILDTSKIEAGKTQLEEEEFNLSQLLEDVVDLYHPVGMKKGIDIVLDPYDGSIINFSQVKGDRGKLKQVLCNLLSNSVKFTSEGHVTVRAWVKNLPDMQNKLIPSNHNGEILKHLSFLLCKDTQTLREQQTADNGVHLNPNCYEFIFEIDDTGKGIPKEKRKLVFENYVQVKETAQGQGTGLGLGIVQSLVRLMGGDIEILDKEIGAKGTCFRFSVLLNVSEGNINSGNNTCQSLAASKLTFRAPSPSPHSPRPIQTTSLKTETSRVLLLIRNDQRRMICKKFMESLGVRVLAMNQWEQLLFNLQKILEKQSHSRHSPRGRSGNSSSSDYLNKSASGNSSNGLNTNVSLGAMKEETNYLLSVFKKTSPKGGITFILILIDASAGPFTEICNMVSNFRTGLQEAYCKVVWLVENQMSHIVNHKGLDSNILEFNDVVISRPFHGSRLYEVIRLLPEFGGTLQSRESSRLYQTDSVPKDPSSSLNEYCGKAKERNSPNFRDQIATRVQQETKSSTGTSPKNLSLNQIHSFLGSKTRISPVSGQQSQHQEIQKPLGGKKILVAEDNVVLQRLARLNLEKLGATVEICENGEAALEFVCNGLGNQRKHGASNILPYDYILMDCEMPVMDGYEATRQIRKVERDYNTHIPIIALTAHASGEEARRTIEAGMDVHLGKPLKKESLLEAIKCIHSK